MTATIIASFVVAAIALAVGFLFSFESLKAWRRSRADLAESKRSGDAALELLAKAQHHHDEAKRHHEIARQVHERADDILRRAREATGSFPVAGVEVDTPPTDEDERRQQRRRHLTARANKEK